MNVYERLTIKKFISEEVETQLKALYEAKEELGAPTHDTRTSPDWHFDGDTLKYHGERDKMYTERMARPTIDQELVDKLCTEYTDWRPQPDYLNCKCSLFSKTPETVLKSCIDLYRAKNKEYQNTEDQFENFTKGAELNQCTREQALWGYCTKQIVSLASIIKTGKNREKISEKARDIIVYMAILEAMQ